jgi:hypothetical protein
MFAANVVLKGVATYFYGIGHVRLLDALQSLKTNVEQSSSCYKEHCPLDATNLRSFQDT